MKSAIFIGVLFSFVNVYSCYSIRRSNGSPFGVFDIFGIFDVDPDLKRNVTELISSKGYPVEDHVAQTEDGYLLSLQRIPHGIKGAGLQRDGPKPVVYLQHGLLSSSADFVMNFPQQSLGFILADSGYEVWMGNVRGNTYSRRHVNKTTHMHEFWDFSFDEMAEYDIPAMIDYVLNATGQKQLYYIGHSQGTTAAFAMLSTKPEYNDKIKLYIAMAPVSTVGHITSPIKYLAPFTSELDFMFALLGVDEFLPSDALVKFLSVYGCNPITRFICEDVMFLFTGADSKQLNATRLPVYLSHVPAGTSTKSIVHFAQMVNSEKFQKYDYGKSENYHHYKQNTPPEYNVSKITTPVALLWSLNDILADPTDVAILQGKLKTLISDYCVQYPDFNHSDFVLAIDAHSLVYDQVLKLLKGEAPAKVSCPTHYTTKYTYNIFASQIR